MVKASKKPSTELSPVESAKLENLESRIEEHRAVYISIGMALGEIRDQRLYRATHSSFEAYCAERWKLSKPYAIQKIEAAETAAAVAIATTPGTPQPANESQCRPLTKLPKEERAAAWTAAVAEAAPSPPTAKQVAAEVARRTEPVAVKEPEPVKPAPKKQTADFAGALKLLEEVQAKLSLAGNQSLVETYKAWRTLVVLVENAKRKADAK